MQVFPGKYVPIKAWVDGVTFDDNARRQVENVAAMPFVYKHVAVMPDVHWGMGATVGSVIATKGAIIPAAVGVDIGCGMIAQRTSLRAEDLPDDLGPLRAAIERAVPHGRTDNGGPNDRGAWGEAPPQVLLSYDSLASGWREILEIEPSMAPRDPSTIYRQLGSLGTGNHFIEICLDEEGFVWIMLHSGSRGIGNRIGSHFIALAKEDMKAWFINVPDQDLAYLPQGTKHFNNYMKAVSWAQRYASTSRMLMLKAVSKALAERVQSFLMMDAAVNCHHNYVATERHFGQDVFVTRKGAVRAGLGELGIIPGSMGVKSFIVEGLGNRESFMSCSHGAGRVMSRGEAKRRISLDDLAEQTSGVECRKDADVIDEAPAAYKPIDAVLAAEADLVTIRYTLKQVLCVKG